MNAYQLDALKEIVNIGIGRAASLLNEMLDAHVDLEVPDLIPLSPEQPLSRLAAVVGDHSLSCVQLRFSGPFSGTALLAFPEESAVTLVSALTGEEAGTAELNSVMAGTLNEVGNILINGVMGSISNILERNLQFSMPQYVEGELASLVDLPYANKTVSILVVRTTFTVQESQVEGNIFLIFEINSFQSLLSDLDRCWGVAEGGRKGHGKS